MNNEHIDDQELTIDVTRYASGSVHLKTWRNREGKLHRIGAPAEIGFYESGKRRTEFWYDNGVLSRNNAPARIHYSECGEIIEQTMSRGQ